MPHKRDTLGLWVSLPFREKLQRFYRIDYNDNRKKALEKLLYLIPNFVGCLQFWQPGQFFYFALAINQS
jgi:hypothetical protein